MKQSTSHLTFQHCIDRGISIFQEINSSSDLTGIWVLYLPNASDFFKKFFLTRALRIIVKPVRNKGKEDCDDIETLVGFCLNIPDHHIEDTDPDQVFQGVGLIQCIDPQ